MTLEEIMGKCGILDIDEKRCISDDYNEIVFYSKEMDDWNRIFVDILGPAIKPAGVKPTEEDLSLTQNYGGIYKNQTLFKKDFEKATVIAMFWPWQDKVHTTLKMVLVQR